MWFNFILKSTQVVEHEVISACVIVQPFFHNEIFPFEPILSINLRENHSEQANVNLQFKFLISNMKTTNNRNYHRNAYLVLFIVDVDRVFCMKTCLFCKRNVKIQETRLEEVLIDIFWVEFVTNIWLKDLS